MDFEELRKALKDHIKFVKGQKGGKRADLRYADLSGIKLDNLPLNEAVLTACNFAGASLVGTDLSGADLQSCNFERADLSEATLDQSDLRGANLRAVRARNASLNKADLRPTHVVRKPGQDSDILGDEVVTQSTDLRQVDMTNAEMRFAKLKNADLENANLERADMTGADLESSNLYGASLRGAILNATNIRFAEKGYAEIPTSLSEIDAELRGQLIDHYEFIKSNGANGGQANLEDRDFDEADLRGINLSAVVLKRVKLRKANLSRTICIFTDFESAQLSGAVLHGADFDATNFKSSKLDNVDLSGARCRPVTTAGNSPDGAGDRSWPVDFSNADLTDANLGGSLFNEVDFRGAKLHGANLQDAKFVNCLFDGDVKDWMLENGGQVA